MIRFPTPGDTQSPEVFRARNVYWDELSGGTWCLPCGPRNSAAPTSRTPCLNLGYVIDTSEGALYHPGDALVVPEQTIPPGWLCR